MKKKIIYIIILILFIAIITAGIIWANNSKNKKQEVETHTIVTNTNVITDVNQLEENIEVEEIKENNEENTSSNNSNVDITVGDNYFVTQINDIYLNFEEYEGKTIEIEGFPLDNGYTFVGRYGPRMLCK